MYLSSPTITEINIAHGNTETPINKTNAEQVRCKKKTQVFNPKITEKFHCKNTECKPQERREILTLKS